MTSARLRFAAALVCAAIVLWPDTLAAHGVARGDARFLQTLQGAAVAGTTTCSS